MRSSFIFLSFSLYSRFSPLILIAAAPISALALFVVAVKEISPPCATFHLPAEGRRNSIILPFLLLPTPPPLLCARVTLSLNSLPCTSHSLCLSPDPLSFHRKHQPSPGMIRLAISPVYRPPLIEESALPSLFSPSFSLFSPSFISAPPLT